MNLKRLKRAVDRTELECTDEVLRPSPNGTIVPALIKDALNTPGKKSIRFNLDSWDTILDGSQRAARVLSLEGLSTVAGGIGGEDFVVESKKSDLSFTMVISNGPEEGDRYANFDFTRNSEPNRDGFKTRHDALGSVEIRGSQAKTLLLDGGKYKLSVVCGSRDSND